MISKKSIYFTQPNFPIVCTHTFIKPKFSIINLLNNNLLIIFKEMMVKKAIVSRASASVETLMTFRYFILISSLLHILSILPLRQNA